MKIRSCLMMIQLCKEDNSLFNKWVEQDFLWFQYLLHYCQYFFCWELSLVQPLDSGTIWSQYIQCMTLHHRFIVHAALHHYLCGLMSLFIWNYSQWERYLRKHLTVNDRDIVNHQESCNFKTHILMSSVVTKSSFQP